MTSSNYPPEPSPYLLTTFADWCLSHGLTVRPASPSSPTNSLATHAPVSLFPSLFPRSCWEEARAVMTAYNAVYAAIASDDEWLGALVQELAEVDDFMAKLYGVHVAVRDEGFAHEFSLGLFRSDYMLHRPTPADAPVIHQVEFNTIASSFGGLASRVSELHRHLLQSGAYPPNIPELSPSSIPPNPAAEGLSFGLASAYDAYGAPAGREKIVLFLVQPDERNVFDQRWLEYGLLESYSVRTHRITFAEVQELTYLDGERRLVYRAPYGDKEVAVVYFRAGYTPDDYTTPAAWEARLLLERSRAIKCPTVATQLAGAKKVQQVLAQSGVLERFLPSPSPSTTTSPDPSLPPPSSPPTVDASRLRATFAGIYPLDTSPLGQHARRLAFSEPSRFVLKPQREGGGNNIYRGKIPAFLESIGERNWPAYILMELIEPPPARGVIVRNGQVVQGQVVGELGVYGVALWKMGGKGEGERGMGDGGRDEGVRMRVNRECGWLLRTKGVESEEGGVAAGFGCVDGVCLVD